jgi:hypothetical protein
MGGQRRRVELFVISVDLLYRTFTPDVHIYQKKNNYSIGCQIIQESAV